MAARTLIVSAASLCLIAGSALADLSGTFSAANVKLTLTERQTKRGGHIDGTLKIGDQEFPLSADIEGGIAAGRLGHEGDALDCTVRETAAGVELRSAGYTVQFTREAKVNPLSAVAESAETRAAEPTNAAAKFPAVFTSPLGFTLGHPANWSEREVNGVGALVPDDGPQIQGQLGEMYALAVAPRGTITEQGLVSRMRGEMAAALPNLTEVGEPEIAAGRSVTLRYRGPESGSPRIAGTVRATITGDMIVVMMGLGVEEAINTHDGVATEVFSTVAPAARAIDERLVGSWTNSSSYSSSTGGGGGFASSRTYTLAADGTYRYTSQTVGGTSGVSADSGVSVETGIWAAKDGVAVKVDAAGNAVRLKYKFVDQHLVVYDAAGKRTIWDR